MLDASPAVCRTLTGGSSCGWSDHFSTTVSRAHLPEFDGRPYGQPFNVTNDELASLIEVGRQLEVESDYGKVNETSAPALVSASASVQITKCQACRDAMEVAFNALVFDTYTCSGIGKKVIDTVCDVAGPFAQACKDFVKLLCSACKDIAKDKCSWKKFAREQCHNCGFCRKGEDDEADQEERAENGDNVRSPPLSADMSFKPVAFDDIHKFLKDELNTTYDAIFPAEPNEYEYWYDQESGHFHGTGFDGSHISVTGCCGAAGHCRNNPAAQCESRCGPLPRGTYRLSQDTTYHGMRHCYVLSHMSGDECGRGGFLIHGGSCSSGNPSIGCIVIEDENVRYKIKGGGKLTVKRK